MVFSWLARVFRRAGALLTLTLLLESLGPHDFESSIGFLGTGGAGFRITSDDEDATDSLLGALDSCPRIVVVVPPPVRLLSEGILGSRSTGGGSMRVVSANAAIGAFCRVR